ncbi:MAG TPA: hypothetical protein VFR67_22800 [Pilimelia sp.]|nr:hypothetical protein [Pilimelia sp.]
MTKTTVAIHGATGTQGSHIARRLYATGHEIQPLGSGSVDLTDIESVSQAYTGIDAVVVQLPLVFDPVAITYAETLLAALAKANVARAVFNPGMPLPPAPIGVPYVDARVTLATGLPAAVDVASVIGPAGPYLENFLQPWSLRRVREQGELAYPLPEAAPVPWLALDDLGDAIAGALRDDRPPAVTVLAGPEPATGDDVAAAVGAAAGRTVRWVHLAPGEHQRLLTPVIGAEAAAGVAAIYEQIAAAPPPPPPAEMLRPATTTVRRWAARQDWIA